jgi:hypothetical protein
MVKLDVSRTRDLLQRFDFKLLFIEELGWSQPIDRKAVKWTHEDVEFDRRQIAQLSGVVVFEVTASNGQIPNAKTRAAIHKEISQLHHENLLIFLDDQRTQSLWYWVKREDKKLYPRDHLYVKGQPGDLFLSKLSAMVVDISELDETGNLPVVEVANRLKNALDVERVTKRFYKEFYEQHMAFLDLIEGIDDDRERRWYASILLNRLMFIYFLQRKGFIDNENQNYLQDKLRESQSKLGRDQYYRNFLAALFFEGFAKPEDERSDTAHKLLGKIKYLNGGLFLPHSIELNNPRINVPDNAFGNLFGLFERYSWNLNDTPGGDDNEINPDVLGYIFEKYINQKAFGAYYTRTEITEYLCEQTIHKLIVDRVNSLSLPPKLRPKQEELFGSDQAGLFTSRRFSSIADILLHLDAPLCRLLIREILPNLSILDPACGSGAFLVAAMKTLVNIYAAVIGHIQVSHDRNLTEWLRRELEGHRSVAYYIKKRIITDNLYGVDVMEEATEIAKLRLFLALVAAAQSVDELEPLPNIDFNILAGNSLIGLMHVDDEDFERRHSQGNLFRKTYRQILDEKNRLIRNYRYTATYADDLRALRDKIEQNRIDALETLNEILLDEVKKLDIKFEEATWDTAKNKEGKPRKRMLKIADIETLHPFHWGYEFDVILNERGGFDAIITNPPWEIFKPQSKEFFVEYSEVVTKNKMSIKEFEKEQTKLLKEAEIRNAWLEYQSRFPHVSLYFRNAPQYKNQISIVGGKRAGTDINLYKLFLEQCLNLLGSDGRCGIILPTGIYTDLGTKQLREVLFSNCKVDTLLALSNERFIFEGVHHSFKFCLLTYQKGGMTNSFRAAFRINPREAISPSQLDSFLNHEDEQVVISVPLVYRLSPDSLSVMEFKNEADIRIAEKMLRFPLLGEKVKGTWNPVLTNEFHMTNDSYLFKMNPGAGRLPLYEGKMVHQFNHLFAEPRYWIIEKEGRKALLGDKVIDRGQKLDYQYYRLGFRDIARTTDTRTMIATIIPPTFHGNKLPTLKILDDNGDRIISDKEQLFITALWNSFVLDAFLRLKVSTTLNFFYVYQLPIPRLNERDRFFNQIISRAAKLICTIPEFDGLAQEVGLRSHKDGVTDEAERALLRAELDGLITHLYGLTEDDFRHLLGTFPLVPQLVKDAALEAYRAFAPKQGDKEIAALIAKGEGSDLEFKSSARWDKRESQPSPKLKDGIVKTIAAFLNAEQGGTLLIGVDNDGSVAGLEQDYETLGKRQNRDGFETFLTSLLLDSYGKDASPLIKITFHEVEGKDVCRVIANPSPRPVFVKDDKGEHLYIRTGNSTRMLSTREAIGYCKLRWK